MQLVLVERLGQGAADPETPDGEHVLQSLAQAGRRVGMVVVELFGEALGGRQALGRVGLGEDQGQAAVDGAGQLLGQVGPSRLRRLCRVRRCTWAVSPNTFFGARSQRLAPSDDAEHTVTRSRGPRATRSANKVGDRHLVLGVTEPQPDGHFGAVSSDDQGRHAALAGHVEQSRS